MFVLGFRLRWEGMERMTSIMIVGPKITHSTTVTAERETVTRTTAAVTAGTRLFPRHRGQRGAPDTMQVMLRVGTLQAPGDVSQNFVDVPIGRRWSGTNTGGPVVRGPVPTDGLAGVPPGDPGGPRGPTRTQLSLLLCVLCC